MKILIVSLLCVLTLCFFSFSYVMAQPSPAGGNWNELDGIDDYAEAPDSDSLDVGDNPEEDLTLEAWVYPRKFPTIPQVFINEAVIAAKKGAYRINLLAVDDGRIGFSAHMRTVDGGMLAPLAFPDGVVPNRWYHVAFVIDRVGNTYTVSLYVDGKRETETPLEKPDMENSSESFFIGGPPILPLATEFFDGRIDEVRVSDVVRYSGESFTLPEEPFTPDENTRGLWHFNEVVGSTSFLDASSNGNTLTGLNGDKTLPVELSLFNGTYTQNGVLLRWQTESETNNLRFHVLRSEKEDGKYIRLTPALIKGYGTTAEPHTYHFVDEIAIEGQTYWYVLEDVDFTGATERSDPIQVVAPKTKFVLWGNVKVKRSGIR